jgi:pyruvate dehydrogenase E1 component
LDQALFNALLEGRAEGDLRHEVLKGGYRLVDCRAEEGYQPGQNVVHLFVSGAMVPEAVAAARQLRAQHIFANVFNVTSGDLLFHDYLTAQQEKIRGQRRQSWIEELVSLQESGTGSDCP